MSFDDIVDDEPWHNILQGCAQRSLTVTVNVSKGIQSLTFKSCSKKGVKVIYRTPEGSRGQGEYIVGKTATPAHSVWSAMNKAWLLSNPEKF